MAQFLNIFLETLNLAPAVERRSSLPVLLRCAHHEILWIPSSPQIL
jgi:hypothetical protein